MAADLALSLAGGSRRSANALLKWLGIVAEDLVELRWLEIVAVASGLLEHRMLNHGEVREIITHVNGGGRLTSVRP